MHDLSTDAAAIGMNRGAYFGANRPLKKGLQIGQVLPIAKSYASINEYDWVWKLPYINF